MVKPHIQRMEKEIEELFYKLESLVKFMDTETFENLSEIDSSLLVIQYNAMNTYYATLSARIVRGKAE